MDPQIHELLERWEASGKRAAPEDLCVDHPEYLTELRRCIDGLRAADALLNEETSQSPDDAADVRHGVSIPGYAQLREICRGGQAVVFSGVYLKTGRKVAVKLMREGPLADARQVARFDREAQILAALNHPNIVTVIDRGRTTDGSHFLAMDFVAGKSLDDYVADLARSGSHGKDSPADPGLTLRLFVKICDAVNAAHLRGIVHRDLKPSNIQVDERGEPRILDFGLARSAFELYGPDAGNPVTITGQFLGSLPWASPEQAGGISREIDCRSDVYSLGVILYQILTGGHFPYEVVGNIVEVLNNILYTQPTPPSRLLDAKTASREASRRRVSVRQASAVNETIEAIVLKALEKLPADRYQSAGELSRDIGNYLAGRPTLALPRPATVEELQTRSIMKKSADPRADPPTPASPVEQVSFQPKKSTAWFTLFPTSWKRAAIVAVVAAAVVAGASWLAYEWSYYSALGDVSAPRAPRSKINQQPAAPGSTPASTTSVVPFTNKLGMMPATNSWE